MKDSDVKDIEKLTGDLEGAHTAGANPAELVQAEEDPRIIELVRFLARAAAEKDYANLIEKSRRELERGKETIQ